MRFKILLTKLSHSRSCAYNFWDLLQYAESILGYKHSQYYIHLLLLETNEIKKRATHQQNVLAKLSEQRQPLIAHAGNYTRSWDFECVLSELLAFFVFFI